MFINSAKYFSNKLAIEVLRTNLDKTKLKLTNSFNITNEFSTLRSILFYRSFRIQTETIFHKQF